MEQRIILSRLLDKYEKSRHLMEPGLSGRRVMLRVDAGELPEYRYDESAALRDGYNRAARILEEEGLIQILWARPLLMSHLILNLERVQDAYACCGRLHPREQAARFQQELLEALSDCTCDWICRWRDEAMEEAALRCRLPKFCRGDESRTRELLCVLQNYDRLGGRAVSQRAFSIACFHDSKRFEREYRDEFLRIAERYSVALQEATAGMELGTREKLAILGIDVRPELFELAGPCVLETDNGLLDLSAAEPFGLAIPGTLAESLKHFDLTGVSRILFIENKTNYDEYLLREKSSDELVLYHGGFSGPQKKQFFALLAAQAEGRVPVSFWADIDLGGFRMFEALQRLFPSLKAFRMGREDLLRYQTFGLQRPASYLEMLRQELQSGRHACFRDVADEILHLGVTLEQEVFLS